MPYKNPDDQRRYYQEHKEFLKQRSLTRYALKKNSILAYQKGYSAARYAEQRQALINFLGGKCAFCGYSSNWRGLCIDHINGDGFLERKKSCYSSMQLIKQVGNEDAKKRYQVLCATCNQIKRYEKGECYGGVTWKRLKDIPVEVSH